MELTRKTIFEVDAHAVVCPVNCSRDVGRGLDRMFKVRRPENYAFYKQLFYKSALKLGEPILFKVGAPWIINLPTREGYKTKGKLENIINGLKAIQAYLPGWQVQSLALPALGEELPDLRWADLFFEVYPVLAGYSVPTQICVPDIDEEELLRAHLLAECHHGGHEAPILELKPRRTDFEGASRWLLKKTDDSAQRDRIGQTVYDLGIKLGFTMHKPKEQAGTTDSSISP